MDKIQNILNKLLPFFGFACFKTTGTKRGKKIRNWIENSYTYEVELESSYSIERI